MAAVIILAVILLAVFLYFVVVWVRRTYRQRVSAGREELVGRTAVVEIALSPRGVVLIEGERWTATLDQGQAKPEEEVIITKVDGLKLIVAKK